MLVHKGLTGWICLRWCSQTDSWIMPSFGVSHFAKAPQKLDQGLWIGAKTEWSAKCSPIPLRHEESNDMVLKENKKGVYAMLSICHLSKTSFHLTTSFSTNIANSVMLSIRRVRRSGRSGKLEYYR